MSLYHLSVTDQLADIIGSIKLMAPPDLEHERELAYRKWFGYRFMSPLSATKHFAMHYVQGLKRHVRTHQDVELSETVRGLSDKLFSAPSGQLTALWRARQRADEMALPYELLVDFAFDFASRRTRKHTPRPIQLFGSEKSEVAWQAEFAKYRMEHIPLALDRLAYLPQYRVENYRRYPVQDEFRSHLVDHITNSDKPSATSVGRQCLEYRHLPLRSALKLVPQAMRPGVISEIRADRDLGLLNPPAVEQVPLIAMVPGCFGLPHARGETAFECVACPFSTGCAALALKASDRMVDRYGSLSPLQDRREDRKKKMTRERVARFRAKKAGNPSPATEPNG